MITELAKPETILYQLVIAAETQVLADTESLDYMRQFDTPDDSDTESDAEQERRDKARVF